MYVIHLLPLFRLLTFFKSGHSRTHTDPSIQRCLLFHAAFMHALAQPHFTRTSARCRSGPILIPLCRLRSPPSLCHCPAGDHAPICTTRRHPAPFQSAIVHSGPFPLFSLSLPSVGPSTPFPSHLLSSPRTAPTPHHAPCNSPPSCAPLIPVVTKQPMPHFHVSRRTNTHLL